MRFEEQIMSKDKYRSVFLCQMEVIVFIILHIPGSNLDTEMSV